MMLPTWRRWRARFYGTGRAAHAHYRGCPLRVRLKAYVHGSNGNGGPPAPPLSGLRLRRPTAPTACTSCLHAPCICSRAITPAPGPGLFACTRYDDRRLASLRRQVSRSPYTPAAPRPSDRVAPAQTGSSRAGANVPSDRRPVLPVGNRLMMLPTWRRWRARFYGTGRAAHAHYRGCPLRVRLKAYVHGSNGNGGPPAPPLSGLRLRRPTAPTACTSCLHAPCICSRAITPAPGPGLFACTRYDDRRLASLRRQVSRSPYTPAAPRPSDRVAPAQTGSSRDGTGP